MENDCGPVVSSRPQNERWHLSTAVFAILCFGGWQDGAHLMFGTLHTAAGKDGLERCLSYGSHSPSWPVPADKFLTRPNMLTVPTIRPTVGTEVVFCCDRTDCLGYLLYYLDVFQFLGSLFTDEPAATLLRVAHVSTVGDTCGLKQNQSSNNLCDLSWHPHWHKCL